MSGLPRGVRKLSLLSLTAALLPCLSVLLLACPSIGWAQDLGALLDRAQAAQGAEQYGQAAVLYRRATTISPAVAELWSNLGLMEYLAGQPEAAERDLHHALKLKPDLFTSLLFLGKVYTQQMKAGQALPFLLRAQAQQPHDAEVLRSLGKAYEALKRERDAADAYREATKAAPQDVSAWLGLGTSSLEIVAMDGRMLATTAPKSSWARALYADELLEQGRPVEAMETYDGLLAAGTPRDNAVLARTLAYMKYNPSQFPFPMKSQDALQRLVDQTGHAVAQNPDACTGIEQHQSPTSLTMAAACAFWTSNYAQSSASAQAALLQAPKDVEALYWSVKANEHIAAEAFSAVDTLAPNSAVNHDLVGDLYRYQHQADNALAEYGKALTIDPHDPAALLGAAAMYLSVNRYDEASAMVQKALANRPSDPQANLLMAEILSGEGREDQAGPYLAQCAKVAPQFQARVHYLLGRIAMKSGNTQEAIRQLELALPGDEDGSTHYQLSRLYRKAGDLAKAQNAEAQAKALIAQREANAGTALRESMTSGR